MAHNGSSSPAQTGAPIEVNIGRAADKAWTDQFARVFDMVTPPATRLHMQEEPGINYVPAQDLGAILTRAGVRLAQSEDMIGHIDRLTGQLRDKGVLARSSLMPVDVHVYGLEVERRKHTLRIRAEVDEWYEEAYPGNYLFQGEKTALLAALGLKKHLEGMRRSDRRPTARVILGTAKGHIDGIGDRYLRNIRELLEPRIRLLPVGPVSTRSVVREQA